MAATPQFANVINAALAQASVANTNRDGTGTLYSLMTGGANGSRVDRVMFKAAGTTVAGTLRIYVYDGTNTRLIAEILMTAITASGTVAAWEASWTPPGGFIELPANWILKYSINDSTSVVNGYAFGGDY